jgi:regulator of CtrA degradation
MRQELRRTELTPKLVDSLYVEAMVLADEARSYFGAQAEGERLALDSLTRVSFACEALKVTTRLMHVIAWLLTQRALAAGELSPNEARAPDRRLGEASASDHLLVRKFPEAARSLIQASEELYARVRRIDSARDAEVAISPARSLISRLERSL